MFFPNCLIETRSGKMRKTASLTIVLLIGILFGSHSASAQLPKIEIPKPKAEPSPTSQPTTSDSRPTEVTPESDRRGGQPNATAAKKIYVDLHSNSTPLLVKDSVYIQAKTHDSYWKLPNQSNYSSWAPTLRFALFYDNSKDLNLVAEYSNPDGSPWFTDELDHDMYKPEPEHGEVGYRSKDSFKMLETKSTVAVGTYGIKITNRDTGGVVFQGKFKVNKFRWDDDTRDKNKFDFFVEHDWLLPIGYVGFAQNIGFDVGAQPVEISVWLKGNIERSELEARLFYNGKQIATTANPGGLAVSDSDEIITEHSVYSADVHNWMLWHFQWQKTFIYDNGGEF